MNAIRLVVQADDFGACHAANRGILRSFEDGIVTQSSMMAPCPWVNEAIALALEHAIPVGMHATLTSEWEHLRWGPLTVGMTLRDSDGGFWRSVEAAQRHADPEEARAELAAQADRLLAAGLPLLYFDGHMGPICVSAFEHVCARHQLPFIYPMVEPCLRFESIALLSAHPARKKRRWLLKHLAKLTPGTHLVVTHPGEPGEELRSLTSPDAENYAWAEEHRVSDLDVLCDPKVRQAIDAHDIELVSVAGMSAHPPHSNE